MRASSLVTSAFLTALAACSHSARPTLPGLVLQLELDGACTAVAIAELPMKLSPTGLTFEPGVDGQALRVDGSGAQIELGGAANLDLTRSLTVDFFVNVADWKNPYPQGGGLESIVSHSDNFTVAIDPFTWRLQARVSTHGDAEALCLAGGTVAPGGWHHVALVLDGDAGTALLFLDGEEVSRTPAHGELVVQPNVPIVVGTWFKKNQAFCGALDSIRIWKRALRPDELAARAAQITRRAG